MRQRIPTSSLLGSILLLSLVLLSLGGCSKILDPDYNAAYFHSGNRSWQTARRMVNGQIEIYDGQGIHDCGVASCTLTMTWTNRRTGEKYYSRKSEVLGPDTWLCAGDEDECSGTGYNPHHESVLPGTTAGIFN